MANSSGLRVFAGSVHAKVALFAASGLAICSALWGSLPILVDSLAAGLGAGALAAAAASFARRKRASVGVVGVLPQVPKGFIIRCVPKSAQKASIFSKLDKSIEILGSSTDPRTRLDAIREARMTLCKLAPGLRNWDGETRLRVYVLLTSLTGDLLNLRYIRACYDLIGLVLLQGGRPAAEMVKSIYGERISDICKSCPSLFESSIDAQMDTLDELTDDVPQKPKNDAIMSYSKEFCRLGRKRVRVTFQGGM